MRRITIPVAWVLLLACSGQESVPKKTEEAKAVAPAADDGEAKAVADEPPEAKEEEDGSTPTAEKPEHPAGPRQNKPPPSSDPEVIANARKLYVRRLNEGRALTKEGKYADAIAVYMQALDVDPSDVALLGELGWAAFKAGDLPGARHATTHGLRFVRKDKTRGMLTYNLGRIAEAEGDAERAAELYRESLGYRDNATVRKRLESLAPPPPPPAAATVGLEVKFEGIATLDDVCRKVIDAYCDEWKVYEDDECTCEPASIDFAKGTEAWAGLLTMGAGMAQELYLPVLKTPAGYTVLGHFFDDYNPGVFGVYGEAEVVRSEIEPDLLGPGQEGWHLEFNKSRMDRDMGLNEIEYEHWGGHLFCAREGDRARCSSVVVVDYGYTREVEFPEHDEEGMTHEGLPIETGYVDRATWSGGTLEIAKVMRLGVSSVDDGMVGGASLPPGKHSLRDLIGL